MNPYIYTYLLLLLAFVFSLYAQIKVNISFSKFNQVKTKSGKTGYMVAREILDSKGLYNVGIEMVRGNLTDHYDPRTNVVRLSEEVYSSSTISATGVAAHECGHAIQYAENYSPVVFRTSIVGITGLCSKLSFVLIIVGLLFDILFYSGVGFFLQVAGVAAFAVVTFFQLITLPVEFNASSRALSIIDENGILSREELSGANKVLSAAALTYVAALAVSLLQLLRLVLMVTGGRRR